MYPNISVGSRFFFFSSLRNHPDEKARNLAKDVDSILNSNQLNPKDANGRQNIEMALTFLYNMYEKESAIEKKYYQTKILENPIIKNNQKYFNMAQSCFSNDGIIDYITFMGLLKIIQSETTGEEWNERLSQIQQEVSNFQNEVDIWLDGAKKTINDFPNPKFIISRLFKSQEYAAKRQQSDAHRALSQTRVINNAILGSTLSKNKTELVNSIKTQLIPFLLSKKGIQNLTLHQERAFTSEIALYLYEKIDKIKNQKQNEFIDIDAILNDIITDISENTDPNSEISSNLLKYSNSILNNLALLEKQGKQMTPTNETITVNQNKITGLTKKVRQRLQEILNLEQDFTNINIRNKKEREKYLTALKKELKHILNIPSTTRMSVKQEINLLNELLATNSKLTAYDETEYRSARGLSAILQTAVPEVVGHSLGKTDVSALDIGGHLRIEYNLDDNVIQQLLEHYDLNFEEEYQQQRQQISQTIYDSKLFQYKNSFNVQAQTRAASKAQKQLAENITELTTKENLTDNKEAIKILKNVFIIDNSVKHSDFIFKGKGFEGGSIGSGVEEQINNICDFFELGGITHADRDWLIFSVLNCGNGLMGAKLRPSLEDYFSIVASMLLFRTGGLLADQLNANGQQYVSANNIHIFTLGPLYVPASYILLTTFNALNKAQTLIEEEVAGSSTTIRNNVSEDDIAQGTKTITEDGQTKIIKVGKWYETYKQNYSRVSIEVQLLGGFLDILEQIESLMKDIPY